jgi:V/A-type H+-transporting ATPase subunit I
MREINLFVTEQDVMAVARAIARSGLLHLLDVSYLGERLPIEHADRRDLIRTFGSLERRLEVLLRAVETTPVPDRMEAKAAEEKSVDQLEAWVHLAEEEINPVTRQISQVDDEIEYLLPLIRQMQLLSPLDVAIVDLRALDYLYLAAGSLPVDNLERLETSLFQVPHVILPFQQEDNHIAILLFSTKDQAEVLDRALKSAYFARFELPIEFSGTLDQVLQQMRDKMAGFEQEKADLHDRLGELAQKWHTRLLSLAKRTWTERYLAEAMEHFGRTGRAYLIAGWIPATSMDRFMAQVESVTQGHAASEVNYPETVPRAQSTIPSALNNPRVLRPFEQIVAIYGQPAYHEIDPTPVLALTFVLMFGMMFGDVGHGFLLAATGLLLISGLAPQLRGWKGFGPVLLACGSSSMLFGFLYGGVFGVETLLPALWLRPLGSILSLLLVSVAFGVVMLNIGFLFNMLNSWRARDWQGLLFSGNGLAGFLLYWMMLAAVLVLAGAINLAMLPLLVVAVVAILTIALGEPLANLMSGKRPLESGSSSTYLVQVFFELFETIVAFLSNSLSYVRLGAFAVAHIGLTSIVFIVGDLFQSVTPIRFLIIVLGTLGVVAFEGLVVGIQTLRLEYYEFFNKFFHGIGIPYQPLDLPEA